MAALKRGGVLELLRCRRGPEGGQKHAHAWVEKDGRILIGLNDTFSKLTKLPPLETEKQ